jgi:hypothetical protein
MDNAEKEKLEFYIRHTDISTLALSDPSERLKERLKIYIANASDMRTLYLSDPGEKLEVVTLDGKVIDGYKDTVENYRSQFTKPDAREKQ